MNESSTSNYNSWQAVNGQNNPMPILNLSLNENMQIDDEIEEDDIEEVEIDENERLHLQKVSSLVEAAYQRVEKFNKQNVYVPSAGGVSEGSSCASTLHQPASLPESLDGGEGEIKELKSLPMTFETGLRCNQILQRRMSSTLSQLEKTLQENLLRQAKLQEEEEEQGILNAQSKDYKESREKYLVRASSFAIPYFKDRSGMPAPMNQDAKYKVDHGYVDLYSTRLRTWLTSEQNTLVKGIQKEWKNKLISDWKSSLWSAQRKLKKEGISEEDRKQIEEEIKSCQNHINFFTNVSADKVEMPPGSKIDWDKVSAEAFDGSRSTEECQLLWENFMHPSINRSPWSEEEDIAIQDSVLQYEMKDLKPNWMEIAESLDSQRTEFQVMKRWVSFIKPTIHPARWTAESSQKLEDAINMLRVGSHIPWARVAQHLPGFTKIQLQSRWRRINPDQHKGPFTSEEDFTLIKGLYQFGMNFELIAHFLPGRNRIQVRERFKRAILPGLTYKPWHWKEDKIIIANCSLGDQRWRTMACALPKRETCQIRLRFYTLHFWQDISKENILPPPLFPLSLTTKLQAIKVLRQKILKLSPDVRIYLDSIQSKKLDLGDVKPFEERRKAIVKNQSKKKLAKFLEVKTDEPPKPVIRHKQKKGSRGPKSQSWPDKALTEFFLPGRPTGNITFDPEGDDTQSHFHCVCQALQLKVKIPITENELKRLHEHINLSIVDANLINQVLIKHHRTKNYGKNCLSCGSQSADIIPLMPPNDLTTGAFNSLLINKPKLEEMASKEFLLFLVPRPQLHKLGKKPKTMNVSKIEINVDLKPETINEELPEGKRRAAAMADIVNYVVSQEERKPKLLKEPVLREEVLKAPSESEIAAMFVEGETCSFRSRAVNAPVEDILKQEDCLLFHRMLSLFFWPALFTLSKPSKDIAHVAKELAQDSFFDYSKIPDEIFEAFDKNKGKLSHLDVEEQEHILKKMEAVKTEKKIRYRTIGLNYKPKKPEVEITQEDMNKRIFKKSILKYKRSLIMKKAWSKRRQGGVPKKSKPKISHPAPVRKSTRLSGRSFQLRRQIEKEEVEEWNHIDEENDCFEN